MDDPTERLIELGISEYQGWSKSNDVSVGRLCEHARLGHGDTKVPSHVRIFRRIDDHCVEQPSAANLCDKREATQFARQRVPKMRSLTASALHELFIFNNLQGYLCDARSDGVAPKRGTVLARLNGQHDFVVGQNCRDRVHPSRKGLT